MGKGSPIVMNLIAKRKRKVFVALEIAWNGATCAVRISMILLYVGLFITRTFCHICWAMIGTNVMILTSIIIASCVIRRPIAYSWNKTIREGTCGNLRSFEHFTTIINLLDDAAIVILPMPMLWTLQMSLKRKIQLSLVLGMGVL